MVAGRLDIYLADTRHVVARLDAVLPGRLAALTRTLPSGELEALSKEARHA